MGVSPKHGLLLFLICCGSVAVHAALLNPAAIGPEAGLNYSDLLDDATNAWYKASNNVTQVFTGGSCPAGKSCLWVPWMDSSSSCLASNLQSGSNCNIGTVNFSQNCMVTDEFSQVGVVLGGGTNQSRFDQWFNTVNIINSSNGQVPAWRVVKNVSSIDACRSGVNGNCDTASDATARIIIALFTASNNSLFTNQSQRDLYNQLARNLSRDMLSYEIQNTCKNSTLGSGPICYWLKAGKQASLTTTDGSYTAYYSDAMIAMLQACAQTGNLTYCAVAGNLSLNYLQASKYDGITFSAPPGRSFKWDNFTGATVPYANCTNTCGNASFDGDETWDGADAVRAFFNGVAEYFDTYVTQRNVLVNMTAYMRNWTSTKMTANLNSVPYQYYPNGTNSGSSQSGYLAQGLQAAGLIALNNATQVNATVWNCMNHYTTDVDSWDFAACPGVYNEAFCLRMLMTGMGRDAASFTISGNATGTTTVAASISPSVAYANDTLYGYCNGTSSSNLPVAYATQWFRNGSLNTSSTSAFCYQETANQTTSCGGVSTGTYVLAPSSYFFINYTKPTGAAYGSKWQVSHGGLAPYNITLPQACWDAFPSKVALTMISDIHSSYLRCYFNDTDTAIGSGPSNGTTYIGGCVGPCGPSGLLYDGNWNTGQMYTLSGWADTGIGDSNPETILYEEAMWWNMSAYPSGVQQGIGNINTTLPKGQAWILACMATDSGGTSSSWTNSSTLTISNSLPRNNWSANNATFKHNASIIFGNYCTDLDGDPLAYSTNNTVFAALSNGSISYASNVSTTGSYSVNVSCSDGTVNTTATAQFTVTNTAPNLTGVTLTPLPAQAGSAISVQYACTDADNDVCNSSVFYAWFKNGVLNSTITGATLGSGNFTTGDNLTGSVRVFDGNANSSWLNTSTATVGDTTPPVLVNFSVSPTALTTASSTTISVNCTDNNQLGAVLAEITDPANIRANYTMSLTSGNVYSVAYPPPVPGTYQARVFCSDGNGNTANTTSIPFTASAASSGSTGSDGGGGGGSSVCSFTVLQPVTGVASNPLCPTGGTSQDLTVSIQNNLQLSNDFTITVPQARCSVVPSTLTLGGGQKGSMTLTNCSCPTTNGQTDVLNVTINQVGGACSQVFTLELTSSNFGSVVQSPAMLLIGFGVLSALAIMLIVVIAAIAKHGKH